MVKLRGGWGHLDGRTVDLSPPADIVRPLPASAAAEVRTLYRDYAVSLHRTLRRLAAPGIDPTDLLHDVFVVAIRRAESMLRSESPRAWLYGAAVKVAADSRKRARLRSFFGLSTALEVADEGTPLLDAERHESAVKVRQALEKMTQRKREVIVLFELEGLTGQEIAVAVGCPLKTVWTRLHHARRDLEAELVLLGLEGER